MILPQNSRHFELFFTGFQSSIQAGSTVAFTVIFDNGQLMSFVGASEGNNIQVTLNDGDVAAWTHNMTAGHSMVISFSGIQENPWSISLSGTTPTITAMAEGINQAGISGLPNPWSTGTRNAQPSAQLGIPSNPSTPSPPPTPQPKNTNSLSPLTIASIIHGLTSSANGQSVIDIENNYSGLACSGDSTICSFGTNETPQALCPAAAPVTI